MFETPIATAIAQGPPPPPPPPPLPVVTRPTSRTMSPPRARTRSPTRRERWTSGGTKVPPQLAAIGQRLVVSELEWDVELLGWLEPEGGDQAGGSLRFVRTEANCHIPFSLGSGGLPAWSSSRRPVVPAANAFTLAGSKPRCVHLRQQQLRVAPDTLYRGREQLERLAVLVTFSSAAASKVGSGSEAPISCSTSSTHAGQWLPPHSLRIKVLSPAACAVPQY